MIRTNEKCNKATLFCHNSEPICFYVKDSFIPNLQPNYRVTKCKFVQATVCNSYSWWLHPIISAFGLFYVLFLSLLLFMLWLEIQMLRRKTWSKQRHQKSHNLHFCTLLKENWNHNLTLTLGLSGLQRAGNNSFNLSFSDLGLTTASALEINKTNKQENFEESKWLLLNLSEIKYKVSAEYKG